MCFLSVDRMVKESERMMESLAVTKKEFEEKYGYEKAKKIFEEIELDTGRSTNRNYNDKERFLHIYQPMLEDIEKNIQSIRNRNTDTDTEKEAKALEIKNLQKRKMELEEKSRGIMKNALIN